MFFLSQFLRAQSYVLILLLLSNQESKIHRLFIHCHKLQRKAANPRIYEAESTFLLEKWSPAMTNWCDYYLIHCSIKMLINHQNNWWMNDKFIHMIKSLMTCYFNNNKYIIQFCPHHVLCTNIYYCSVCSFALYFFSKSLIHNTYLISCEIYRF